MSPAVADFYSPDFASCDNDGFSGGGRFRSHEEGGFEGGLTRTRPRRPRLIKVRRKQGRSNESKGEGDRARGSDRCYWNGVVDGGGISRESVGKENCVVGNGGTVRGEDADRKGVLEREGFGSVGNGKLLDEKLEKVEFVFGAGGKDIAAGKGKVGSRAIRKLAKPVRESEADDEGSPVASGNLNSQTLENPFFVESGGFGSIRKDSKNVNKDMFVFGRTSDFTGGDVARDAGFTFQVEVNESSGEDKHSHSTNGFETSVHRVEEKESSTLKSGASPFSPLGGLDLPNFDTSCLRASLFSEQKLQFSRYAKPDSGKKAKRKNQRVRPPSSEKLASASGTSVFSEDQGTSSYSPMDSSPYQETAAKGPDVSAATLGVADGPKGESTTFWSSLSISNDGTSYTTSSPKSEANAGDFFGKDTVGVAENGSCIPPNTERKATRSDDQFVFTSGSGKIDQQSFIFASSSSSSSSAHVYMKDGKQICKNKIKVKGGRANSAVTSAHSDVGCGTSLTQSSRMSDASPASDLDREEDAGASSEVKGGERVNLNVRNQVQKNSLAASGVQEACDTGMVVVDGGGISRESVGKENCAVGNGGTVRGEDAGRKGVLEREGFESVGNGKLLDEKLEKVEFVFGTGGKDIAARKGKVGSRAVRKLVEPVRESEVDDEGASVDSSLRNFGVGKRGEGEEVGYSGFNFNSGAIGDNGVKGALCDNTTDQSGEVANIVSNNCSFSGLPDSLGSGGESATKLNIRVVNNSEDSGKSKASAGNEWKTENGPILHREYVFGFSWSSDLKVETQGSQEYPHEQDSVHNARGRLETSAESQNGESENPPLIFGQNSNLNCSKGPAVFVFKGDVGKSSDRGKIRTSSDRPRSGVHSNRSSIINSDAGNPPVNDKSVLYQDNSTDTGGSCSIFDLPEGMNDLSLHDCVNLDISKRKDSSASDSCVVAKSQFIFGNGPTLSNPETVASGDLNSQTLENPFFVESGGFGSIRKDSKNVNKDMPVFGRTSDFTGGDVARDAGFTFQVEVNESSGEDKHSHSANGFETSVHRVEEKESSTLKSGASPSSLGGLDLPNFDTSCLRASLFSEQKLQFSRYAKPDSGKKAKRKNQRVRPPSSEKLATNNLCASGTSVFSENQGTSSYSPMDSSPYQETAAKGPDVSAATLGVADGPKGESTTFWSSLSISNDGTSYTTSSPKSEANAGDFFGKDTVGVAENGSCIPPNTERKATRSDDQFVFTSGSGKIDQQSFIFASSSSSYVCMKDGKRICKKKIKVKSGRANSAVTSARSDVGCGTSFTQSSRMSDASPASDLNREKDAGASSEVKGGERVNLNVRNQVQKNSLAASGVQEACDKWRLRGNQSYKCGNFTKAEEFYTNGINAVPSGEKFVFCLKPLLLCYSNRAATRVSLGRIREAIEDCLMASALDPDFLKVQLRTANCHLVLGEVEDASVYFNKCLVSGADVCLDRRLIIDAADGLRKAQKVTECMNASSIILEEKTVDVATKVIEIITEALSISKFSEKLMELKAEALHILQKHQEVIQLCQKSLSFAEINFPAAGITEGCFLSKIWRSFFVAKSHFCLGRLEEALDLLDKVKQFGSSCDKLHLKYLKSSISLATIIRKLQQCKNAGNEAFLSGKYAEAVDHYSNALLCNVESRSFAAVCFCNRAASFQALGQIADAIADCSVAIALDGHYIKAIHRRATLHELIRDFGQASSDTQRLVSVLENQRTKPSTSGSGDSRATDLRKARKRWSALEEEGKNGVLLDYYLILGVKLSDSASDIKKAYHKAALRHHPDKAGQLLSRSESCSEGRLWKELSKDIHDDADRLFKLIGEAYAVLSDPSKRSQYDHEEEIKKAREGCDHGSYPSKFDASPSGRSTQRQWRENWRTYGYSGSR